MSHKTLHESAIHLPLFHNSNNIWWQVKTQGLISYVPKPSLQSFVIVTDELPYPHL